MPKISGPYTKNGHVIHPDDKAGHCFYCDKLADHCYDYVPPKEIAADPKLMSRCPERAYAVHACMDCKKRIYPHKKILLTVGVRREFIRGREALKPLTRNLEHSVTKGVLLAQRKLWQVVIVTPEGLVVSDIPDGQLSADLKKQKEEWVQSEVDRITAEIDNVVESKSDEAKSTDKPIVYDFGQ